MKKKVFSFIFLFCFIFLLTGCGQKDQLRCSYLQEQSGLAVNQVVNLKFKEGIVSNVKLTIAAGATTDDAKSKWDEFIQEVDKQYPEKEAKGLSVKRVLNKDDNVYKLILDIDISKVDDKDLENYGLNGIAGTSAEYSATKESFEKNGFTCE